MGDVILLAILLVVWCPTVGWAAWISYRTGRENGYDEGFADGQDAASTSWEKAIEKRGLIKPDPALVEVIADAWYRVDPGWATAPQRRELAEIALQALSAVRAR